MIDSLVRLLPLAQRQSKNGLPERYALVTLHRPTSGARPAASAVARAGRRRRRFGYRRLQVLLVREVWVVNHKRVYRLYVEEKLGIRRKRGRPTGPRRKRE